MTPNQQRIVDKIAQEHRIPEDLALLAINHRFNCSDPECQVNEFVTPYLEQDIEQSLGCSMDRLVEMTFENLQTAGKQLGIEGFTSVDRLIELVEGAMDAAVAEARTRDGGDDT